jgi:hypothetical protein
MITRRNKKQWDQIESAISKDIVKTCGSTIGENSYRNVDLTRRNRMKKLREFQIYTESLKRIFDRFQQNVDNEKEIGYQDARHVGKKIARTIIRSYYLGSKLFPLEKLVKTLDPFMAKL